MNLILVTGKCVCMMECVFWLEMSGVMTRPDSVPVCMYVSVCISGMQLYTCYFARMERSAAHDKLLMMYVDVISEVATIYNCGKCSFLCWP